MPQRNQPKSLVDLSIKVAAQNILRICAEIESLFGGYDETECRERIQAVQHYLLETMPAVLLDKLCERRSQSLEYALSDHRVLLAVYFHKNMRGFSCSSITLRTITDENFWLQQIMSLKNLVILDFKLMCTDEILEVVGENCPKLEYINCISKMSTTPRTSILHFNALKVELHVSDVGLSQLCKCRRLKKITMNRKINSQCAGKKPTFAGIRNLLKSLPDLQGLTFEDLGSVISRDMEDCKQLSLLQLSDTHPTAQHMVELGRLCPKLKELMLVSPVLLSAGRSVSSGSLTSLSQTPIQLELLGLEFFPFDSDLLQYLTVKGEYLVCLQLLAGSSNNKLTSKELILIGKCCLNLNGLHLHGMGPETGMSPTCKSKQIFTKLSCISLAGENWNPYVILPLCVLPAQNLVRLSLFNRGNEASLAELFEQLMSLHSLSSFKMLFLLEGCPLPLHTLHKFIYHCPSISVVKIKPILFKDEEVFILYKEFTENNFNIVIEITDSK